MGVLVMVEDEPWLARTFKRVLGKLGYDILHFGTVPEARAYLAEHPTPEVLLLDRQVAFHNGWSLKDEVGAGVRVVLMTGDPPKDNVLPFYHKGVDSTQRLIDLIQGKDV